MNELSVRFLKPEEGPELEKFVAEHPFGGIEQTWDWGVLQTTIPGRTAFYVLGVFDDEDKLIGSMLLIRQQMGLGKTWLWCPGGPLLPENACDEAWRLLREKCDDLALKERDVFLRIEPKIPASEVFVFDGDEIDEQYLPAHTLVIDLTVSEDKILGQMTQKGRYNIKKAAKAGVVASKSTVSDFDQFLKLLATTAVRDGFKVHDNVFYEDFLAILDGKAHFYVAKIGKKVLAGMLAVGFGDTMTYYYGASSDEHRNAFAPYALQWFAICSAKRDGFKYYDFLGISPEGDDKDSLAGVTQFKTRFGGQKVDYKRGQLFIYDKFWWVVYKFVKKVRG